MSRGSTAAKVAESKRAHPEHFCPEEKCLWRTGGGRCPKHVDGEIWEEAPNEDLKVGDMVYVLGVKRIVGIRPYTGPYDFIFGIADTVPGVGFSLERGGYTRRVQRAGV